MLFRSNIARYTAENAITWGERQAKLNRIDIQQYHRPRKAIPLSLRYDLSQPLQQRDLSSSPEVLLSDEGGLGDLCIEQNAELPNGLTALDVDELDPLGLDKDEEIRTEETTTAQEEMEIENQEENRDKQETNENPRNAEKEKENTVDTQNEMEIEKQNDKKEEQRIDADQNRKAVIRRTPRMTATITTGMMHGRVVETITISSSRKNEEKVKTMKENTKSKGKEENISFNANAPEFHNKNKENKQSEENNSQFSNISSFSSISDGSNESRNNQSETTPRKCRYTCQTTGYSTY